MEQKEFEEESILDHEQSDSISGPDEDKNRGTVIKSSQAPDFVPWEEESFATPKRVGVARNAIIKKGSVIPGAPLTIVPKIPNLDESGAMTITPIEESETIVGMTVTCACGRSQEVRFEFDL